MRLVNFIARLFGWLLTPLVAWAASFLGATATSYLVGTRFTVRAQLVGTIVGGGIAAAIALTLWLKLLRRSPRLRETLHVTTDATPVVAGEEKP